MKITPPLVPFSFSSKPTFQAGFSLLEMAVILVVLGIIGGLSLPLLTAHINRTAHIKTLSNQEYALNAIAAYVERKRRFPCPASQHAIGKDFGLSKVQCQNKEAKGLLPFKTLGISEIYAKDGFKRFMTYVVEPELTKKDNALHAEQGGWITIKKEEGDTVVPPQQKEDPNPNYVALILISHGESGIGAYLGGGKPTKLTGTSISPHKKENTDDNFIFIESSQTDDLLRWESRDQFLKHYVTFR